MRADNDVAGSRIAVTMFHLVGAVIDVGFPLGFQVDGSPGEDSRDWAICSQDQCHSEI